MTVHGFLPNRSFADVRHDCDVDGEWLMRVDDDGTLWSGDGRAVDDVGVNSKAKCRYTILQ